MNNISPKRHIAPNQRITKTTHQTKSIRIHVHIQYGVLSHRARAYSIQTVERNWSTTYQQHTTTDYRFTDPRCRLLTKLNQIRQQIMNDPPTRDRSSFKVDNDNMQADADKRKPRRRVWRIIPKSNIDRTTGVQSHIRSSVHPSTERKVQSPSRFGKHVPTMLP